MVKHSMLRERHPAKPSEAGRPRPRLALSLLIGIGILVVPSVAVFQWFTHTHPVYDRSVALIRESVRARQLLGAGLEPDSWVYGRVRHGVALFVFGVEGDRSRGKARVLAKREEDGHWRMEYVQITLEGTSRPTRIYSRAPAGR